jgi:hypothetical protein
VATSLPAPIDPATAAWLLDPAWPTVRRLARTRLGLATDEAGPPPPAIADEPWVRALITQPRSSVHPYAKWAGPHWRLGSLAELDADPASPEVASFVGPAFDAVAGWLEAPGRIARADRQVRGRSRICGSQEGLAAWAAIRLGLGEDPRVAAGIERLLRWQWPDGGWNCDKRPEASHSSFNESWGAVRALAAFGDRYPGSALGRDARTAADRAAEFLLEHRVVRSHTTGELAHPNVDGMRWPPYWHYDRLVGLRVLLAAGRLADGRTAEALDELRSARRPDGTWRPDRRYWKAPSSTAPTWVEAVDWTAEGERRMVTLQALEVLAAARDRG